jgi:hypothetical protein
MVAQLVRTDFTFRESSLPCSHEASRDRGCIHLVTKFDGKKFLERLSFGGYDNIKVDIKDML